MEASTGHTRGSMDVSSVPRRTVDRTRRPQHVGPIPARCLTVGSKTWNALTEGSRRKLQGLSVRPDAIRPKSNIASEPLPVGLMSATSVELVSAAVPPYTNRRYSPHVWLFLFNSTTAPFTGWLF